MIDNNLLVAVVTSVTTAGSTAGVAITALVLNNKRFDLIEKRLDKIEARLENIERDCRNLYLDIGRVKGKLGIA